jgi:hypothetical protein
MLWTAPPPARECQRCGCRLRLPRFGGATHAVNFDNRSRYRQVGLSEIAVDQASALTALGRYARGPLGVAYAVALCQLSRVYAPLSLADRLVRCGSCARARSPASVNASKLVFPVFAHRMMLWATRLRRLCVPPFGQRSQAFSSATSIAAIVGRLKRSTIIC